MYLAMAGVDYKHADISDREKLCFTQNELKNKLHYIKENCNYSAIIVSTCNRTEVYFSGDEELTYDDIAYEFSCLTGMKQSEFHKTAYVHMHSELVKYLFELACGLHSLILGEDQIITQLNDAAKLARENKAANAVLNTLFQHAVTCAKLAKTRVNISFVSPSIVSEAILILKQKKPCLNGVKALVIGNGEMGQLAGKLLIDEGCEVQMTLRQYKYTIATVPEHCKSVPYEDREDYLSWADVVFSATKSPHYTLTCDMFENKEKLPKYIFDMALPRDIEPKILQSYNVEYFDVDAIGKDHGAYNKNEISQIEQIINAKVQKYYEWHSYREMLLTKGVIA